MLPGMLDAGLLATGTATTLPIRGYVDDNLAALRRRVRIRQRASARWPELVRRLLAPRRTREVEAEVDSWLAARAAAPS